MPPIEALPGKFTSLLGEPDPMNRALVDTKTRLLMRVIIEVEIKKAWLFLFLFESREKEDRQS
ncbi:MAG TPA: hypothetical protein VFV38_39685 [Ktedonobacteraceae bacterium]|nr:hypothetical protein [Ktedonobacteraceae bacterium]